MVVIFFLWYFGTILDFSFQELVWSWVYVMTTKSDLSWHYQFDSIPKLVMKFLFSIYQVMCKETSVGGFSVMEDSIADRKVRNKDLLA